MPHGDDGDLAPQFRALRLGQGYHVGIMPAYAIGQLLILVRRALPGLHRADIPVAQIRHGTDDQLRRPLRILEHQHLILRGIRANVADHMHIKHLQQLLRRLQERGRVMVARDDHHMPAFRAHHPAQEAVIEFLGEVARRAGIEDIPRHQQRPDFILPDHRG